MGRPTDLVRDYGREGSDPVGDEPLQGWSLKRIEPMWPTMGSTDLRRADDLERYPQAQWNGRRYRWQGKRAGPPAAVQVNQGLSFPQRRASLDSSRPFTVVLFLVGGVIGWSLLGAVLAFAPGLWVDPVLGLSSFAVCVQYLAWWKLGGSLSLLWPNQLGQMASMLGLPGPCTSVSVYGAMIWFAIAFVVRLKRGAGPVAADHHWVTQLAWYVFLVAAIAVVALWAMDRVLDWIGEARARRGRQWIDGVTQVDPLPTSRGRWLRVPLRRWAGQVLIVLGTAVVFLLSYAQFG
jgi:hypothetical protein